MKTNAIAAVALSLLAFACAAPEPEPAGAESAVTDLASTSDEGASLFRGSFTKDGARYTVEVELVSKQRVQQVKYCDPYVDEGERAAAGAWVSPSYTEDGGTITTRVRSEGGAILGESTRRVNAFSAYVRLDPAASCTTAGKIADKTAITSFPSNLHLWVPGVAVKTPGGEVWINPSYGGVADTPATFAGTAKFRHLAPATEATFHSRPFGGRGQEIHLGAGELTFEPAFSVELEVGTVIEGEAIRFATQRETVTLTPR